MSNALTAYEAARQQTNREVDPTRAENMERWWARLKELEAIGASDEDDSDDSREWEWACWFAEDASGRHVYSRAHRYLVDGDDDGAACGASPSRGVEWVNEADASPHGRCGRCS